MQERIEINKQKYLEVMQATEREGMPDLLSWLQTTDFFVAPASTFKDFHGCYPGGLCQHSLNVMEICKKKISWFLKRIGTPEDLSKKVVTSAIICAGIHDFCKISTYKVNTDKWWVEKKGKLYECMQPETVSLSPTLCQYEETDFPSLPHGTLSFILALRHGLKLTDKEIEAVQWHMGDYDLGNGCKSSTKYAYEKCHKTLFCFLLYTADNEASKILDDFNIKPVIIW